jgi:hypothetical protein
VTVQARAVDPVSPLARLLDEWLQAALALSIEISERHPSIASPVRRVAISGLVATSGSG